MHVYRKYRVPVSLTAGQTAEITRLRHGQREVYNWAISEIKGGWDINDEYGLHAELTVRRAAHDHVRAIPTAVQRAGIQDAFRAARLSIKYGRGGLKYRSRKISGSAAVRCSQPPKVIDSHFLRLPVFGTVRCRIPDQIMEHEPRSYEFVRMQSGRYMLYVSCRVDVPAPRTVGMTYKGIDRGVAEPTVAATISPDGRPLAADSYDTAAPFRQNREWNRRMQRKASKMNKRSKRYRDHLRKIDRKMRKVLNRRTYAECVAARHIVCDGRPGVIVFENLNLSKMTRSGGSHK